MPDLQTQTKARAGAKAQSHPDFSTFWKIGAVLFVITGIEFGIVYLQGMQAIVLGVLAVLSILKFWLVAAYFMHLKWDGKLLGWTFAVGVLLAAVITLALKFVMVA